ncbi:MAG TPA: HEAT repeat domain-containing protein [Polyangia bacterium]|nr:HEAT repeat domain-containing protein [Polyangia bacterium]
MRVLVIASLVFSTVAWGAPSAAELDRVLGGYEHAATADEVKRLGAGADQILIGVAEDARSTAIRRTRAIAALRFVPSAAAHAYLRALILEQGRAPAPADVLDVAAALGALAPYGRAELPLVQRYLGHASAELRQSAAAALGLIADAGALPSLRARLAVERDPAIRTVLSHSIKTIETPR